VVLRGTVELEEVMLHHQEEWVGNRRTGGTRQTRTRVVGAGEGFHHLPLVTSASTALTLCTHSHRMHCPLLTGAAR
jgi:hypothetical protein